MLLPEERLSPVLCSTRDSQIPSPQRLASLSPPFWARTRKRSIPANQTRGRPMERRMRSFARLRVHTQTPTPSQRQRYVPPSPTRISRWPHLRQLVEFASPGVRSVGGGKHRHRRGHVIAIKIITLGEKGKLGRSREPKSECDERTENRIRT